MWEKNGNIGTKSFKPLASDFQNMCTKMKFSNKDFLSKCDQNLQETTDLVRFTKEILKSLILNFIFCAVIIVNFYSTY